MITLDEAKNILRVDGTDNDALIASLIESLPGYIEVSTGMGEELQEAEPLVKTVSGFILTLWYYADHADDVKLQRTINHLLKCISLKARPGMVYNSCGCTVITPVSEGDIDECLKE